MKRIKLISKVALPEQRIASCPVIGEDHVTLSQSNAQELERAITRANNEAEQAQVYALDPTITDDPDARTALDDAIYRRDRLQAALPQLAEPTSTGQQHERKVRWLGRADAIEQKRDALACEFAEGYPDLIDKLVDLFQRVQAIDAEVEPHQWRCSKYRGTSVKSNRALHPCQLEIVHCQWAAGLATYAPPILPEQVMPVLPIRAQLVGAQAARPATACGCPTRRQLLRQSDKGT